MAKVFIYNEKGKVIEEQVKGKGKPPKGSTRDENGDFHYYPQPEKVQVQYVTISVGGKITREDKKQGKTRHGYTLQTDGKYQGHYLKQEVAKAPAAPISAEITGEVETPATETAVQG